MLIAFLLVFFLLQSGDMFKRKIVKIAGPTLSRKKVTVEILDEINRQIGGFLSVRAVASLAVAVVTWLALKWLGVENAGVWGMAAGVLNSIPYFGPLIGMGDTARQIHFGQNGAIKQWITSGAIVVMGTDSGTPLNFNTEALWREISEVNTRFVARVLTEIARISAERAAAAAAAGAAAPVPAPPAPKSKKKNRNRKTWSSAWPRNRKPCTSTVVRCWPPAPSSTLSTKT